MIKQKIAEGTFAAKQLLKEGWLVKHVWVEGFMSKRAGTFFVMELQDEPLSEPSVHEIESQDFSGGQHN